MHIVTKAVADFFALEKSPLPESRIRDIDKEVKGIGADLFDRFSGFNDFQVHVRLSSDRSYLWIDISGVADIHLTVGDFKVREVKICNCNWSAHGPGILWHQTIGKGPDRLCVDQVYVRFSNSQEWPAPVRVQKMDGSCRRWFEPGTVGGDIMDAPELQGSKFLVSLVPLRAFLGEAPLF